MKNFFLKLLLFISVFSLHDSLLADCHKNVTVLAHRGVYAGDPLLENKLEAFIAAWEKGFGVELDIRVSKDGHFVVIHDESVARISNEASIAYVDELTASELAVFGVPTLEQVLSAFIQYRDKFSERYGIMMEIKTPRKGGWVGAYRLGRKIADRVALANEDGQPKFIISSFNPIAMKAVKNTAPGVTRCLNTSEFNNVDSANLNVLTKWLLKKVLLQKAVLGYFVNPEIVSFEFMQISKSLIEKYHQQGVKVFVSMANNEEDIKTLLRWGVDGFVSDNPELVKAMIDAASQ